MNSEDFYKDISVMFKRLNKIMDDNNKILEIANLKIEAVRKELQNIDESIYKLGDPLHRIANEADAGIVIAKEIDHLGVVISEYINFKMEESE